MRPHLWPSGTSGSRWAASKQSDARRARGRRRPDPRLRAGCWNPAGLEARHVPAVANPAGEVFVGGDGQLLVQVLIIERGDVRAQGGLQFADLGPRESAPARRQRGPDLGDEAVAMESAGAVSVREDRNLAGGLERHRGGRRRSRSGGHPEGREGIGQAGFGEALGAQQAGVASAAGSAIRARVVAAAGQSRSRLPVPVRAR